MRAPRFGGFGGQWNVVYPFQSHQLGYPPQSPQLGGRKKPSLTDESPPIRGFGGYGLKHQAMKFP